jgi:hypothetical protein
MTMSNISRLNGGRGADDEPRGPTFRRTRAGSQELVSRRMNLDRDQRQLLLYANGKRSIEELSARVAAVDENPDLLFDMESAGLIEMFDPELGEVISAGSEAGRAEVGRAPSSSAPQRNGRAPSFGSESDSLADIKREIGAEITTLLGAEGSRAVRRLEQIDDWADLAALLPKLKELVKLSGGVRAGERFGSKYAPWMR